MRCMHSRRADQCKTPNTSYMHNRNPYNNPRNPTGSGDGKIEYSRDVDGKPCQQWNWCNECGFTTFHASHVQHPSCTLHICAWCANKYQWTNFHQERSRQNKKRFQDKKDMPAAETTGQTPQGFH